MMFLLRDFRHGEGGATAIEYALIAAFLSIGILLAVTGIGEQIVQFFTSVETGFS